MQTLALTRAVPPSINRCQLSHIQREPIDWSVATEQHERYEGLLGSLGCRVQRLPPLPDAPDSVFVEDTAVVLDEVAIVTRPGAESRRAETTSTAEALAAHRELHFINAPGTLDGGDVLRFGKKIYVGRSARTNAEAIRQLQDVVTPLGYEVLEVHMTGCLHLKTAVSQVAENALLLNPDFVEVGCFADCEQIMIDPSEPLAANALWIGGAVVFSKSYPHTAKRLARSDIQLRLIDVSELAKAEAGVTCCSLIFRT